MIFPITFILTLFVTQVSRVVAQSPVQSKAFYGQSYDANFLSLNNVSCSNLIAQYPKLENVPGFPFIGGAPNTPFNSLNCGKCWNITNVETGNSTYFTAIDYSGTDDFVLSKIAYRSLGGRIMTGSFDATAEMVDDKFCANQHT